MLVLSRRESESLKIGDDGTVTVLAVRGGQVHIGIAAPKEVVVHRQEVYERIHADGAAVAVGDITLETA